MSASIWNPDGVTHALGAKEIIAVACSDLSTSLIVASNVGYFYVVQNSGFTLAGVEATLLVASTSGVVTVNVKKNAVSIFTTKITIDVNEKTSVTAVIPAVIISTATTFEAGDLVSIDIDGAGTGAKGLIVSFRGNFLDSTLD